MHSHFFRLVPFTVPGRSKSEAIPPLAIEITGTVALETSTVSVIYQLTGATAQIKYASTGGAQQSLRKNELWRTTCFEVFMKLPGSAAYWEYNLAPDGGWNVYRFTGYRSALQPDLQITDIKLTAGIAQMGLAGLQAKLPLPAPLLGQKLAIGISAVVEDRDGHLHYFALRHAGDKPDFHDPAGFDINLDPARHDFMASGKNSP